MTVYRVLSNETSASQGKEADSGEGTSFSRPPGPSSQCGLLQGKESAGLKQLKTENLVVVGLVDLYSATRLAA